MNLVSYIQTRGVALSYSRGKRSGKEKYSSW